LPPPERHLIADAPESVEILLREKGNHLIVHLINVAKGTRSRDPKSNPFVSLRIDELPAAPGCRVSVSLNRQPHSVRLQPQNRPVAHWQWENGRVTFEVPNFEIHQMVVITAEADSPL